MRYELADCEWAAIEPMLPNKPRVERFFNRIKQCRPIATRVRQARCELPRLCPARVDTAMGLHANGSTSQAARYRLIGANVWSGSCSAKELGANTCMQKTPT